MSAMVFGYAVRAITDKIEAWEAVVKSKWRRIVGGVKNED